MLNLDNVTLLAIDGAGNNPLITKALQISKREINFNTTILLSPSTTYSNLDNIILVNIPILTYDEFNKFVLKELYKYINTSHYLFVDSDGFIINPSYWTDEFLDYDYIGSPWRYPDHIFTDKVYDSIKSRPKSSINLVGNGGFTFRSKRLLEIARKCTDTKYRPEDVYICINNYDYMIENGIKFSTMELANRFAQDPLIDIHSTFGFHGNKIYINNIL